MVRGEEDSDDLAVDLFWPGAEGVSPGPRPGTQTLPGRRVPEPKESAPPRPAPAARRPRPKDASPGLDDATNDTLIAVLEHLNTLSSLVTGTHKESATGLQAMGARVEQAVAELEALQLRIVRSLAGFDALRLRLQKELAGRPALSESDLDTIADAVTQRLLTHVRVETEESRR